MKAKCVEETLDFDFSVGGPNTDMVTMLVGHTRTFDIELNVNTIAVGVVREEFAGGGDSSGEGVLGVMDATRLGQSTSRKLSKVNLLGGVILDFGDDEVRSVTTLSFLNIQSLGKSLPHAILPRKVILLHTLIVITLATLTNPDCTHLSQIPVDIPGDEVVMLVSLVAETKGDIFETGKLVLAISKLE